MTQKPIFVLLLTFFLLPAITSRAQNYTRRESATFLENGNRDIYLGVDSQYIVVNYRAEDNASPIVHIFTPALKELSANPVKELSGTEHQASLYTGKGLYLVYADKEQRANCYAVDYKTGNVMGAPVPLFSFAGNSKQPYIHTYTGNSIDGAYYYIVVRGLHKDNDPEIFNGAVTDRQMKVLYTFTFTTPANYVDINDEQIKLSNTGILNIIYNVKAKTSRDNFTPLAYTVTQISGQGKAKIGMLTGLPVGYFSGILWQALEDKITFAGLLQKTKRDNTTAILTGTFDPSQGKTTNLKEAEISEVPFIKNATDKNLKEIAKKGIPSGMKLNNSFTFDDGSRTLVYEDTHRGDYSSTYAGTSTVAFSGTLYQSYDVYVIRLNAENEVELVQEIAKNQLEADLSIHIGAVCMADHQQGIHIFFYDALRYTAPYPPDYANRIVDLDKGAFKGRGLASVYVSKTGKMNKQFLYENRDMPLYLTPEKSISLRENELIAIYLGTPHAIQLSEELFLKHTQYQLGTITVVP